MENFASKYRPTKLSEVVGQELVVDSIRGMLSEEKIPPTILLSGPHGCGKTTLGRLIILYANCMSEGDEPCGECPSCVSTLKLIRGDAESPHIKEVDCAANRGIDKMRSLKAEARMKARYNYRFHLMDEVHMLTKEAFNSSLKLFEEPPGKARFILCTTEPEKLPKTILSRCVQYTLKPVTVENLSKLIFRVSKREELGLKKSMRHEIAMAADGHPRDALNILQFVDTYKKGGGNVTKEHLPKVIAEASSYAPWFVVAKYMEGVLAGRYGMCFVAISTIDSHQFMVKRIVETWQEIMLRWIEPSGELNDPAKAMLIRNLQFPNPDEGERIIKSGQMARLLDEYCRAAERIKTYLMDPVAVMQVATLNAIQITSTWGKPAPKKRAAKKKRRQ